MEANWIFREYQEIDLPFIFNSWLRASWDAWPFAKDMRKTVFFEMHHDLINKRISKKEISVVVACAKDGPSDILGYIAFSQKTGSLHFVYVKGAFRKLGIGKSLFETRIFKFHTHETNMLSFLKLDTIYNPYLFIENL